MRLTIGPAKLVAIFSVLALTSGAACATTAPPAPTAAPAPKTEPAKPAATAAPAATTAPAAAPAAKAEAPKAAGPTITIKAQSELADPKLPNNVSLTEFKRRVEEASGGSMRVELFFGTVGTAKETLESLVLGTSEINSCEVSNLTGYAKEFGALKLPYIVKSREHIANTMRATEVGTTLERLMATKGIQSLSWHPQGGRIIGSNKPVRTVADMAGLKIRIMNDPVMLATYQALGASPVPIAWGETYLAMKQGVVDAVDTAVPDGLQAKMPEVSKYASITNSTFSLGGIYANKKWFDGLTAEQKKIVSDAAKAGSLLVDTEEPKLYNSSIEEWKKTTEIINPDLSGFRTAVAKIYPDFYNQFGKEIIEGIVKAGEKY